jgi:MAX-like protein X
MSCDCSTALDYIQFLQSQSSRHEEQLVKLKREVKALRIMKENYEQIARTHQSTPSSNALQVPDHVKFMVFQGVSDQLFQSFNSSISVTSFDTLSSCVISWLEEYCKPQTLRELVITNLQRANACPLPQRQPSS